MKKTKIILGGGIAGVILLGLITNAIWDALKPLTGYLFNFILNLSILGIEKFKNNIYIEIAKGMHESISLQLFLTVYSFIFGVVLMLGIFIFRRKILNKENILKYPTFLGKMFFYPRNLSQKSWFLWFIFFYLLFAGTIFMMNSVKQKYINVAITNFEQLSKIVRPYISEEDDIKYLSNFSQIRNKKDYVLLINELQKIAKDNNQSVPEFNFTF